MRIVTYHPHSYTKLNVRLRMYCSTCGHIQDLAVEACSVQHVSVFGLFAPKSAFRRRR